MKIDILCDLQVIKSDGYPIGEAQRQQVNIIDGGLSCKHLDGDTCKKMGIPCGLLDLLGSFISQGAGSEHYEKSLCEKQLGINIDGLYTENTAI